MKYRPKLWLCFTTRAVHTAHNVIARAGNKLRHPSDTRDKEAAVDEEKNYGRITVRLGPVNSERQLKL